MKSKPLNMLVLASFAGGNANVIRDYLFAFNRYSRHRYFYVFDPSRLDATFDFASFDVIIIFWSTYICGPTLRPETIDAIAASPALRVLFLQDEYRDVRPINAVMARLGIHHMFTCVEPHQHDIFYPPSLIPSLRGTHTVLTGYVPEYIAHYGFDPTRRTSIDIGYRSRDVPPYLGDLGRAKRVIADRMTRFAEDYGFSHDISVKEEARIYGSAWIRFLRKCRFTIGTPSGASVVDFSGDIRTACAAYLEVNPGATYDELRRQFFADVDGKVVIETISPRIFEAAALGNVLILQAGNYSGIIQPDRHYIEIARDYSNLDTVAEKMRDSSFCRQLAEQAFDDLIASDKYSFRSFVRQFDEIIEAASEGRPRAASPSRLRFALTRYVCDGQCIIPFRQNYLRLPSVEPFTSRILRFTRGDRFAANSTPGGYQSLRPTLRKLRMSLPPLARDLNRSRLRTLAGAVHPSSTRRRRTTRLLKDLYHIEIIRLINARTLLTTERFDVVPFINAAAREIHLCSVPEGHEEACLPGVPAGVMSSGALSKLLPAPQHIKRIIWDHTLVGGSLWFRLSETDTPVALHFEESQRMLCSELSLMLDSEGPAVLRLLERACDGRMIRLFTPDAQVVAVAAATPTTKTA